MCCCCCGGHWLHLLRPETSIRTSHSSLILLLLEFETKTVPKEVKARHAFTCLKLCFDALCLRSLYLSCCAPLYCPASVVYNYELSWLAFPLKMRFHWKGLPRKTKDTANLMCCFLSSFMSWKSKIPKICFKVFLTHHPLGLICIQSFSSDFLLLCTRRLDWEAFGVTLTELYLLYQMFRLRDGNKPQPRNPPSSKQIKK